MALAQYRMAAEREKRQAGGGQEENGDAPEHLFLRSGAGNKQPFIINNQQSTSKNINHKLPIPKHELLIIHNLSSITNPPRSTFAYD